jgi:hypothetical protein
MNLTEHVAHGPWQESRPCVYCACGARLYQGRLPKGDRLAWATAQDAAMERAFAEADEDDKREWAARTPEQERVYGEGFAAFREDVDLITRLGLCPYTPKKLGVDYRSEQALIMRWWSMGWNDAEFKNGDRRTRA